MGPASAIIIAAVAVLLIHMLKNAESPARPYTITRGDRVNGRKMRPARTTSTPCFVTAAASRNPPRNSMMMSLAKGLTNALAAMGAFSNGRTSASPSR